VPPPWHRGSAWAAARHLKLPGWFEQGHGTTGWAGSHAGAKGPWQCPEQPWCPWQSCGQGEKCHLPGTANPGSIAQWEGGLRAVLEVLSWGEREVLWERGSYKSLGLGQPLPALFYKQINLVEYERCSLIYLAPEIVVGSPQAAPYGCK